MFEAEHTGQLTAVVGGFIDCRCRGETAGRVQAEQVLKVGKSRET